MFTTTVAVLLVAQIAMVDSLKCYHYNVIRDPTLPLPGNLKACESDLQTICYTILRNRDNAVIDKGCGDKKACDLWDDWCGICAGDGCEPDFGPEIRVAKNEEEKNEKETEKEPAVESKSSSSSQITPNKFVVVGIVIVLIGKIILLL